MATVQWLAALTLLYSLSGASAIRNTISGADTPPVLAPADEVIANDGGSGASVQSVMKLLNKVSGDESFNRMKMVAGNCGRMTVRKGLDVGESVKVTSNGWLDEDVDFVVNLVSDETEEAVRLRREESQLDAGPSAASPAHTPGDQDSGGDSEGDLTVAAGDRGDVMELPSVPFVGIRIPGAQKAPDNSPVDSEAGSDAGESVESASGAAEPRKPSILLYNKDPDVPTIVTLDSPAGPQTPIMVIFTMISLTEMEVALYTWQRSKEETVAVPGIWHKASATVGTGSNMKDLAVSLDNCRSRSFKAYASASANLLTKMDGMCDNAEAPILSIYPSYPSNRGVGGSGASPSAIEYKNEVVVGHAARVDLRNPRSSKSVVA